MSKHAARPGSRSQLVRALVLSICFVVVAQLAPPVIGDMSQFFTPGLLTDAITLPILWGMFMVFPLVVLGAGSLGDLLIGTLRWFAEREEQS